MKFFNAGVISVLKSLKIKRLLNPGPSDMKLQIIMSGTFLKLEDFILSTLT